MKESDAGIHLFIFYINRNNAMTAVDFVNATTTMSGNLRSHGEKKDRRRKTEKERKEGKRETIKVHSGQGCAVAVVHTGYPRLLLLFVDLTVDGNAGLLALNFGSVAAVGAACVISSNNALTSVSSCYETSVRARLCAFVTGQYCSSICK